MELKKHTALRGQQTVLDNIIALRPYNHDYNLGTICKWLYLRKAYIPFKEEFPKIGYVAYKGNEPIAAAFLRIVEGDFAQIDGLCTNPEALPQDRSKANDLLIAQLIETAKEMGNIKTIVSYSLDKNTIMRAESHGFVATPHTVLALDLKAKTKGEH